MKIKYLDKKHKKINKKCSVSEKLEEGLKKLDEGKLFIAGATTGLTAVAIFISICLYTRFSLPKPRVVASIPYVQNEQTYNLDEIYIFYKESEIRKCLRKGYVYNQDITDTYVAYEFFDIATGEKIAHTKYNRSQSDDAEEEKTLNGYKYIRLSDIIYEDLYEKKVTNEEEVATQEYIDDIIENKRFLGR